MGDIVLSWSYTEEFVPESEPARAARLRAAEFGLTPVSTGTGVASVWLLEGMADDGVLTSIDVEAEYERAAREAFTMAGVKPARTRLIAGRALDVLPRLADGAYDLAHIDGDKEEYPEYVEQAIRLLRPGGILAIDNMLWHDRVADPAARDEVTTLLRDLGKRLREDDRVTPCLLPVGDGLLVAVRN